MATYIRLTDYKDSDSKEQGFFKSENRYEAKQDDFEKIHGSPIAYWVSETIYKLFSNQKLGEISAPRKGNTTTDNDRFLRNWYEVEKNKIALGYESIIEANNDLKKWFPYNKGGGYKKWYGFNESLINWESDGAEIRKIPHSVVANYQYYMLPGITWSTITTSKFGVRDFGRGFIFDNGGCCIFIEEKDKKYIESLLNSNTFTEVFSKINPTINFQSGEIAKFPIIFPKQESIKQQIDTLTGECIDISKEEWDSRETSWDFTKNELLKHLVPKGTLCEKSDNKIETAFNNYCSYWKQKFYKLHANEEELNRLFIDIYELGDELTPDVDPKDITILKNEAKIVDGKLEFVPSEIMKQFISYAVGVMFGRYSLDHDGLHIANMDESLEEVNSKFNIQNSTFQADDDNVIPVLEDDYFSDDIASRVVNFVKTAFGAESLSENINFIEKCLGKTIRTYMVKDFYEDHIKRYKKRPIYWMVASPKKGFMSLSYMHRYQSDLFARVQNNYLREYITKLEGTKEILNQTLLSDTASSKDKKEADKKIKAIEVKLKELIAFDRDTMTHFAQNRVEIDLDDGVKVNYGKFKDILYPIKGME